jgi:hypothetical protein
MRDSIHLIACMIERGGFTSERIFRLRLANGDELAGSAFVDHVLDENRRPLDNETSEYGQPMPGFVKCRMIREQDGGVLVEVPSADVIPVSAEQRRILSLLVRRGGRHASRSGSRYLPPRHLAQVPAELWA